MFPMMLVSFSTLHLYCELPSDAKISDERLAALAQMKISNAISPRILLGQYDIVDWVTLVCIQTSQLHSILTLNFLRWASNMVWCYLYL